MDFLTHVFLPLTVVYVVYPEWFDHPAMFAVGGFGLLSDFDKFLGAPGLLHSLVTLVPICLGLLAVERLARDKLAVSPVIVALIGSHLVLDFIDGGPVPLLFPFVTQGLGLQYPIQAVFGQGPFLVSFQGPLVTLRTVAPRPGYNTYGFINGAGVASMLAFVAVYAGRQLRDRGPGSQTDPAQETRSPETTPRAGTDGGVERDRDEDDSG